MHKYGLAVVKSIQLPMQGNQDYLLLLAQERSRGKLTLESFQSEFLANMSHELRTPLNGILGYAQILQRDRSLEKQQLDGIDIIYQCGNYLLTLINDILDLSKIEARKMELYPQDFHFPSFLTGVAEICQIKARQKNIAFIYQASPSLPEGVRADNKRLRQVLINLLGNAIEFTDSGSVTFKVESIDNLLSPIGLEVMEASNGLEGIEKAAELKPDLIITDLVMPQMHGFEFIQRLRSTGELQDAIVITSSASLFEADRHKILEVGSDDFLPKPVQVSELLEKLRRHLKIEWVYENRSVSAVEATNGSEVPSEPIVPPPAEQLTQLYDLIRQGLILEISEEAKKLAEQDRQFGSFSSRLIELAQDFEVAKIKAMLEKKIFA